MAPRGTLLALAFLSSRNGALRAKTSSGRLCEPQGGTDPKGWGVSIGQSVSTKRGVAGQNRPADGFVSSEPEAKPSGGGFCEPQGGADPKGWGVSIGQSVSTKRGVAEALPEQRGVAPLPYCLAKSFLLRSM